MQCPPEIAEVVTKILTTGLLRIRAIGWSGYADRCAIEADHLHNLPALLSVYRPELLEYYWRAERTAYVQRSSPEDIAAFEPLWNALGKLMRSRNVEPATAHP